ncbi:MAG: cytochrome c biogenesis protein CcsA [Thermoproteota archaeon]
MGLHYTGYPVLATVVLLLAALYYSIRGDERGIKYFTWSGTAAVASWLVYLVPFTTLDFSLEPVFENSSAALPLYLRPAVAWSTGGGSLFLLTVILLVSSKFGLGSKLEEAAKRKQLLRFTALASAYSALLLTASILYGAFSKIDVTGLGMGFNPLLKSYWVYPHPLLTFGGYGVLIAASLASIYSDSRRGLVLLEVGWGMLSLGMLLGGLWSYETFGWGGYWAWDPVEVSQLMVWLATTLLFHLRAISRGELDRAFAAFILFNVTLALYVTRTGLSPLHGFASPSVGGYLLITMTVASLAFFIYSLYRSVKGPLFVEGLLRKPYTAGLAVAVAALLIASLFVTGTLLVPSFLASTGRSVTVPQMDSGISYYHPILYPLSLVFLAGIVIAFLGDRAGWKGAALVLGVSGIFSGLLAWQVLRGNIVVAPLSPALTQAEMVVGLVFASAALASVAAYIASLIAEFRRRLTYVLSRNVKMYAAMVHLFLALSLIGVYASGTYAYSDEYFKDYTLRPGEAIELPGGGRLRLVSYSYELLPQPVDIYTGYVGKTDTYFFAWEALLALDNDLFDIVRKYYEGMKLLERNTTIQKLLALLNKRVRLNGSTVLYEGSATLTSFDVAFNSTESIHLENVTLKLEDAEIATMISQQDGTLRLTATPRAFRIEAASENEAKLVERLLTSIQHKYFVLTLGEGQARDVVLNERENVSFRAEEGIAIVPAILAFGADFSNTSANVSGAVIEFSNPLLVLEGVLVMNGTKVSIPARLGDAVTTYLAIERGGVLKPLLRSSLAELALKNAASYLLSVNVSFCPPNLAVGPSRCAGFIRAPKLVPETARLRLGFVLERGETSKRFEAVIRFDVNGEIQGIHGLVTEVVHVDAGPLTDIYISIAPPTIVSNLTGLSYHELAVYYLAAASEQHNLTPEDKLALSALLASGLYINALRSNPQQRAALAEQATIDLYLLSERMAKGEIAPGSAGVSISVKVIPGVDLVWWGPAFMAFTVFLAALVRIRFLWDHGVGMQGTHTFTSS